MDYEPITEAYQHLESREIQSRLIGPIVELIRIADECREISAQHGLEGELPASFAHAVRYVCEHAHRHTEIARQLEGIPCANYFLTVPAQVARKLRQGNK